MIVFFVQRKNIIIITLITHITVQTTFMQVLALPCAEPTCKPDILANLTFPKL